MAKEEEELSKAAIGMASRVAIGAASKNPWIMGAIAVAFVLGIIAFIFFVPAAYKIIVGIAAIALALVWFGSKKEKRVFNIIVVSAIAVAIVIFLPQIKVYSSQGYSTFSNAFSTMKSGNIGQGLGCIGDPSKCFGEQSWQTVSQQSLGGLIINVDWKAGVYEKSVAYIPVSVKTDNPLLLNIQCVNEKTNINTQPAALGFGKGEESTKTAICTGEITNKLGLKISIDSNLSKTALVWIGNGASKGKLYQKVNGPYSLEINTFESMPFNSSKKVFIKLKRESDFNLTRINSFDVQTIGSNIALSCPVMTGSSQELAGNFKDDTYTFTCDLDVLNVPASPEQSSIKLNVDYSLEALYKTNLNISKS